MRTTARSPLASNQRGARHRRWGQYGLLFGVLASTAGAQGANVDVTVMPFYTAGQAVPLRDGFTVCIGTPSNYAQYGSQLTPFNGVANTAFKNLPVGQQVVIRVNKAGYVGLERTTTLQADWNNHIQMSPQTGSGGPSCPNTSATTPPVTTPPPTTSPPPATTPPPPKQIPPNLPPPRPTPPQTFTLRVQVLGVPNGHPLGGAQVCIGRASATPDFFATAKPTDATGWVAFTGLPFAAEYRITATKGGYMGRINDYHPGSGITGSPTITLMLGSGGATCPNTELSPDGIANALAPLSPPPTQPSSPPTPARLGEERLARHGYYRPGAPLQMIDCKTFGSDFVVVAIDGQSGLAIDRLRLGCARVLANGTLGNTMWTSYAGNNNGAATFTQSCGANRVVVGMTGWMDGDPKQVRGIELLCRSVTATGLTTGTAVLIGRVGGNPGTAWPADNCSANRPARAMQFSPDLFVSSLLAPYILATAQLICEQPLVQ